MRRPADPRAAGAHPQRTGTRRAQAWWRGQFAIGSRRVARSTVIAVVAVLLVLAAVIAVRSRNRTVPVATHNVTVTAPGGPGVAGEVRLDATLYLPPDLPAPAVVLAHGFGGSKDSIADDARELATHGFVVLAYSARGFGRSTGQIALDSLDYEVADARALVGWLAGRSEVVQDAPGDPRVGFAGGSYGGALALMAAGTDPRVDAVAASITWNDLGQSLFPNDQVAAGTPRAETPAAVSYTGDGVFKKAWAAALISSVTSGIALGTTGTAPGDTGGSGFPAGGPDSSGTAGASSSSSGPAGSSGAGPGTGSGSAAGSDPAAAPTGSAPDTTPRAGSRAEGIPGCGRLMPALCAAYAQAAQSGRLTPELKTLLARSNPAAVVGNIKAPTLLVQGERDTLFGLDQADANARAIAANGTPVAVTWYDGGHDGGAPHAITRTRIDTWFEHYLRREGDPPATTFDYSVSGPLSDNGRARTRTLQAAGYPGLGRPAAPVTNIALTGRTQIAVNPPGGSPAAISSLPGLSGLAGTALSNFAGGLPGQTAQFTSAPMTSLTVLTGTPRVTVQVARLGLAIGGTPAAAGSSAPTPAAAGSGAVLFASLAKVSPSGLRTVAGSAVAPVRLTGLPADGSPATVTVELPATAFQVEAGSSLQVSLSTTDQAYASPLEPASYTISLAGSAAVSVPQAAGTRVSAGEVPVAPLVGVLVLAALGLFALVWGGRVRKRRSVLTGDESLPLEIVGLRKSYPGGITAVTDVSFRVEHGMVLGLLGPNGAGKTTTLRMVMGLIAPSAGEIRVFGRSIYPGAPILSRIGSFVEGSGFLPHLSGRANLELYWKATGRPMGDAHLDAALEIAGLGSAVARRVKTYSQGMRQRLAIAQAMLGLPDLLLLDEPTNGLDPPQIHAMREVLRGYAATGRTVLISSHLLSEVEQTCSHVVVVNQGRTIAAGTVTELVSASGEFVFTVDDVDAAVAALRAAGVRSARAGDTPGSVEAGLDEVPAAAAVSALVGAGVAVSSAAPRNRLEDVFLELVGASGPTSGGAS